VFSQIFWPEVLIPQQSILRDFTSYDTYTDLSARPDSFTYDLKYGAMVLLMKAWSVSYGEPSLKLMSRSWEWMALSASIIAPLLTQIMLEKYYILWIKANQKKNYSFPEINSLLDPFMCIFSDCTSIHLLCFIRYVMSWHIICHILVILTNSNKQSPSWEGDSRSAGQEILC
jgi:hypothetical protein